MSIPKVIHYCWFGGNPLPPLAEKCIASWRKFLPDYEIKKWNETNFDVNSIAYTREAYAQKRYAFVSDYARFWILYHYGGVYFDTDVEVIKPMDDIIQSGAYIGIEKDSDGKSFPTVAPGLGIAAETQYPLYRKFIEYYGGLHFSITTPSSDLQTIVDHTTEMLKLHGLKPMRGIQHIEGITIYPSEYFCPIDIVTHRLHITDNTYSIHHYAASWQEKSFKEAVKSVLRKLFPESMLRWYNRKKHSN